MKICWQVSFSCCPILNILAKKKLIDKINKTKKENTNSYKHEGTIKYERPSSSVKSQNRIK